MCGCRSDARMSRSRAKRGDEARPRCARVGWSEQQLDRDLPLERAVDALGQPDLGHAARADRTDQTIGADPAAFGPCGDRRGLARRVDRGSSSRKAAARDARRAREHALELRQQAMLLRPQLRQEGRRVRFVEHVGLLVQSCDSSCQSMTESRIMASARSVRGEEYVARGERGKRSPCSCYRVLAAVRRPSLLAATARRARHAGHRRAAAWPAGQHVRQGGGCLRATEGPLAPWLYRSGAVPRGQPRNDRHRERRDQDEAPGRAPRPRRALRPAAAAAESASDR